MSNESQYLDLKTGLFNEDYFKSVFDRVKSLNKNVRLISIDLQRFKTINDTLGHDVGDKCLKWYADVLSYYFDESRLSLCFRLHGDEYAVLTDLSEDQIANVFNSIDEQLEKLYVDGIIPVKINFNAGDDSVDNKSLEDTFKIADFMMMYAKKKSKTYQPFRDVIWETMVEFENFFENYKRCTSEESFSYCALNIRDKNLNPTVLYQIYTRSPEGEDFLGNGMYDALNDNIYAQQLDFINLNKYLMFHKQFDKDAIILINKKSILRIDELLDILSKLTVEERNRLILAVDVRNIDRRDKRDLIYSLQSLKSFGVKILLDKYNGSVSDDILSSVDIDYIRIEPAYLLKAAKDDKIKLLLAYKLKALSLFNNSCIPIFGNIQSRDDLSLISELTDDIDVLYSGHYFDKEEKIELKNKKKVNKLA